VHDGANGAPRNPGQSGDVYNAFGQWGIWDIVDFVYRNALIIIVSTLASIAVAVVYVLTAVPLYTANGQLLIDLKIPHLATEQWRETGMVLDSAQIESQIAVLRSEPVAIAVVDRLGLLDDPSFSGPLATAPGSAEAGGKPMPTEQDAARVRTAVGKLQGGLGIRRLGFAYVLEISYTAPDREFAARAANAYMQAYIDDQISMRADTARQGSEWLERRINTLRLQMNEASLKVQSFKARRDYSIVGRSPSSDAEAPTKDGPPKGFTETLDELESTAMTYRRMFESALQAYTEAEQRQSYAVSSARVILRATPTAGRSYPKRKEALAVAIVAGLALGLGIALVREGLRLAGASRRRRATLQDAL
jgi:uncharacterized protein involved in exopolysaccharide biosynthesis